MKFTDLFIVDIHQSLKIKEPYNTFSSDKNLNKYCQVKISELFRIIFKNTKMMNII